MTSLGIGLSLLCALATNVAFLCKHRGAVAAPAVSARHPWQSLKGLFASRWWAIGWAIGFGAWVLHVGALAIAPLSLVQAVIAGGLVLLALPAERWFGFKLGRREWIGLGLSAFGLAFLMLTASGQHGSSYSTSAMTAFTGGALGVGLALLLSGHQHERLRARPGPILAIAAGLLIGLSDVAIKALTETVPGNLLSILSPWTLAALVASICALYAIARALQLGEAIQVIALSSVAANLAAISGGVLVFGDAIGADTLGIVLRGVAFAAVITAAAFVSGPVRAADALAGRAPART
jgi:drug/metabolite transporter (DMT)-like permease